MLKFQLVTPVYNRHISLGSMTISAGYLFQQTPCKLDERKTVSSSRMLKFQHVKLVYYFVVLRGVSRRQVKNCNGLTDWMVPLPNPFIYLHPNNCHEGIPALKKLNKQHSNAATGNRTRAHCLQSERLEKDQKRTSPFGLWHQHSYAFVTITPSLDETRPRTF